MQRVRQRQQWPSCLQPQAWPRVCANSGRKTSRSLFCAYRWTQNDGAGLEPRLCAEMNKANNGWPIKARIVHKPIRQRLHEESERVLFCIRQTQTTNVARVHVGDRLRRWAAGCTPGSWGWRSRNCRNALTVKSICRVRRRENTPK
jgi:hypothetical protein